VPIRSRRPPFARCSRHGSGRKLADTLTFLERYPPQSPSPAGSQPSLWFDDPPASGGGDYGDPPPAPPCGCSMIRRHRCHRAISITATTRGCAPLAQIQVGHGFARNPGLLEPTPSGLFFMGFGGVPLRSQTQSHIPGGTPFIHVAPAMTTPLNRHHLAVVMALNRHHLAVGMTNVQHLRW